MADVAGFLAAIHGLLNTSLSAEYAVDDAFAHQNEHEYQLLAAFDANYAYVEEYS